jgi:hypothetical protein
LEHSLVQVEQASFRFTGIPLNSGTVDVRAVLAAPAIKIWGFIKSEETLRVFYTQIFKMNIITEENNEWIKLYY